MWGNLANDNLPQERRLHKMPFFCRFLVNFGFKRKENDFNAEKKKSRSRGKKNI